MKTRIVLAIALGATIATGAHALTSTPTRTTAQPSFFPVPTCDPNVTICP